MRYIFFFGDHMHTSTREPATLGKDFSIHLLCCSVLILISMLSATAHAQQIVAHRGASFDAPENTLAAFRLAWEKQADAIEGDFYLTKDGQIVCIHDKTTKRVSPKSPELKVASATLDELRALDVGSWKDPRYSDERVPVLKEVLDTVPDGKRIFVEIKCGPEIVAPLKKQLATCTLKPEQIVIICFNKDVVVESRRVMPQYKVNWLTSYKQESEKSVWEPAVDSVVKSLKETNATGLGTNGNLDVINRAFVDAVRSSGHEFHVWTVNDEDDVQVFQKLNVDSITTDRPAFVRSILEQKTPVGTK